MQTKSFFTLLLLGNLILIAIIFGIGFWETTHEMRRQSTDVSAVFQKQLLEMVQSDLEESWPNAAERIEQYCRSYSKRPEFRLTIVDTDGNVLGESEYDATQMGTHITEDRAEILDALDGKWGESIRDSSTKGIQYRYFALPVFHEQKVVAVVRVAFLISDIKATWERISRGIQNGFLAMVLVAVVLSTFLSWLWYRPLRGITRMAQRISDGYLDESLHVSGSRELVQLSSALDRMRRTVSSQLKTITTQRETLHTILRNLPDAIFAMNSLGHVVYYNESAKSLFRLDAIDHQELPLQGLVRCAKIIDFYQSFRECLPSEKANHSLRQIETELFGRRCHFELEYVEIGESDDMYGITSLLLISDLTPFVHTNKMKTDFVANASHELRTPLTTIKAALENLADGVYENEESFQSILAILQRHVSRLEALINDLLSLGGVEDETVPNRLETTTLESQKTVLLELYGVKAEEKGVMFSLDAEPASVPFEIDVNRLNLILQNLLDNAIKFTPSGGTVNLSLSLENEKTLVVQCKDSGCGIPLGEQHRVFERFYQVNPSKTGDTRIRGTGLGLAIVKHAVERLHGTIQLESRVGEGTVFLVRLPLGVL